MVGQSRATLFAGLLGAAFIVSCWAVVGPSAAHAQAASGETYAIAYYDNGGRKYSLCQMTAAVARTGTTRATYDYEGNAQCTTANVNLSGYATIRKPTWHDPNGPTEEPIVAQAPTVTAAPMAANTLYKSRGTADLTGYSAFQWFKGRFDAQLTAPTNTTSGWTYADPQRCVVVVRDAYCNVQPSPFFTNVNGSLDEEAMTDPLIDSAANNGELAAQLWDFYVGNQLYAAGQGAQAAWIGLPSPAQAYHIMQCGAAIIGFIAGNALLVGKIRKAGGIVKVAKVLIKARNPQAALQAIVGGAAEISGVGAVVSAC